MTEMEQGPVLDVALGLYRIQALVADVVFDTVPTAFADDKFTFVELKVLRHLITSGPTTFSTLTKAASVTDALLREVMWSLSDGGSVSDEDGRLSVTEKGIQALRMLKVSAISAYVDALKGVSPEVLQLLAKSLYTALQPTADHPQGDSDPATLNVEFRKGG